MNDLSVEEARARMLALAFSLPSERLPLEAAFGRVLAETIAAERDQPPFNASAMDGWAVSGSGTEFRIVGESAAGHAYAALLNAGEAVRIFTGAPVPAGAERVVIQEEASAEGGRLTTPPADDRPHHIRPAGGDFRRGQTLLQQGMRLDAWRIGLAAAAGRATLEVARPVEVVLLSTGEEIVPAGVRPAADQIFDSGGPTLARLIARWGGAEPKLLRAGDDAAAITRAIADSGGDVVVTLGGASVGDHDLVKPALAELGLELSVETVRMRPGKPTWCGVLADGRRVVGLPGNPASALVCAELFLRPLLAVMQGAEPGPRMATARLAAAMPPNGGREHWARGRLRSDDGALVVEAMLDQDSSLVKVFAEAGALIRRSIGAPAAEPGSVVD
ncbi:MAG TPA: molybdopterin molybdotransferase MoeA, partial [Caulobacteraceae bacterium]|nr:molybdopterin molybdotransferase MoeA [Caulobacteraceae bacterium]